MKSATTAKNEKIAKRAGDASATLSMKSRVRRPGENTTSEKVRLGELTNDSIVGSTLRRATVVT